MIIASSLLFKGFIKYELHVIFAGWFFRYLLSQLKLPNTPWYLFYQLFIISSYHYGYVKMEVVFF